MLLANSTTKTSAVIEPDRCCVEDWEVLAFESEEELHLYTIWHDDLRKSSADALEAAAKLAESTITSTPNARSHLRSSSNSRSRSKRRPLAATTLAATTLNHQQTPTKLLNGSNVFQQHPTTPLTKYQQRQLRKRQLQQQRQQLQQQANHPANLLNLQQQNVLQMRSSAASGAANANTATGTGNTSVGGLSTSANLERVLPQGYTVVNPTSEPSSKYAIRYKSTKLYNKYRGQQIRTAAYMKKQREQQILAGLTSGCLNTWLAYSALQALRIPNDFWNPQYSYLMQTTPKTQLSSHTATSAPLSTTASKATKQIGNTNGFQTPKPQTNSSNHMNTCDPTHATPLTPFLGLTPSLGQFSLISTPQSQPISTNPLPSTPQPPTITLPPPAPMPQQSLVPYHLIVVGPGKVIPYSNRIYPQQVAEYKRKSHLLPSTASSKKSSAASYDVNEIMEVLANTTKTNVTITRNAIKSSSASTTATNGSSSSSSSKQQQNADNRSVYSHTVNANAHGIVSTQLHLQARSYLDSMSKFYAEEWQLIEQRERELMQEPSIEEQIGKYLNLGSSQSSTTNSTSSATASSVG